MVYGYKDNITGRTLTYVDIQNMLKFNDYVLVHCDTEKKAESLIHNLSLSGYKDEQNQDLSLDSWFQYDRNTCYLIYSFNVADFINVNNIKYITVYRYNE